MTTKLPPDRHFGFLFMGVFALLAANSYLRGGHVYPWYAILAGATALVTFIKPQLLRPFNALWMRLAGLLHRIVNPVVLGVIFFLALVPVGIIQRFSGRDSMRRSFDPKARSYWINREHPGPVPESLLNQF